MLLPLLFACAPEPEPDTTTPPDLAPTTHCTPEDLPPDTLAWTDPGPGGVSAEEVFGFAAGAHGATLTWDDGTTTEVTLAVTPVSAIQQRTGQDASCSVEMTGLADWTVSTADGRVSVSGSTEWQVADASLPTGGVFIEEALDDTEYTVEHLELGSARRLRLFLGTDGDLLMLEVQEAWTLTSDLIHLCIRGALDPTTVECRDANDNPGPD